jgi:hypothetical protein
VTGGLLNDNCDDVMAAGIDGGDVRFGSKADMGTFPINVRFTPESRHRRGNGHPRHVDSVLYFTKNPA